MKPDDFYYLEYLDFYLYCYIHNVSADGSFNVLHVFLVKLWSLRETLLRTFDLIHEDRLF